MIGLYIVFGNNLAAALNTLSFLGFSPQTAFIGIISLIGVKVAAAILIIVITPRIPIDYLQKYQETLLKTRPAQIKNRNTLSQLTSATFLIPGCCIGFGLWLQGVPLNEISIFCIRSIATLLLLTFIGRKLLSPLIQKAVGHYQKMPID